MFMLLYLSNGCDYIYIYVYIYIYTYQLFWVIFFYCSFWKYMYWWHPVSNFVYLHECQCLNIRPSASYLAILVSDWDSWKHMTHVSRRTVVIWDSKVMYNLIAFFKTPIPLYMDCNHAQNQGNKISVNPVEGLSIQPVKWWWPWESQLINKCALDDCPFTWEPNNWRLWKEMRELHWDTLQKFYTTD